LDKAEKEDNALIKEENEAPTIKLGNIPFHLFFNSNEFRIIKFRIITIRVIFNIINII
jgi:hypothetical protein